MDNFETTLILSPDLSSEKMKSELKNFEENIKKNDGDIIAQEDWGLRDLSYKIKNAKKAFYIFYQIKFNGNKIQDLKKTISQNEKILRYLFIKVKDHDELPTKLHKSE